MTLGPATPPAQAPLPIAAPAPTAGSSSEPATGPTTAPAGASTRPGLLLASAAGLAGVVLVIVGTFLPWLVSGGRGRNIYQLTAVADKLGFFDNGLARAVPTVVGLLGPACILPLVLGLLRLRRIAAIVAMVCGMLVALPALGALMIGGRAGDVGIRLASIGPVVVLVGGVLLLGAGILALVSRPAGSAALRPTP